MLDGIELVTVAVLTVSIAVATIAILLYRNNNRSRSTVIRKSIQVELNAGEVPSSVFHTGNELEDHELVGGFAFDEVSLGTPDVDVTTNDCDDDAGHPNSIPIGGKVLRPWLRICRPSFDAPPNTPHARSPARSPARSRSPATSRKATYAHITVNPTMLHDAPATPSTPVLAASKRRSQMSRQVAATVNPSKQGLGLTLTETASGNVAIGRVLAGGPAWIAKLAAGDEMVSVNGIDVTAMPLAEAKQCITMHTAASRLGNKPVAVVTRRFLSRAALEGSVRHSPPCSPASSPTLQRRSFGKMAH